MKKTHKNHPALRVRGRREAKVGIAAPSASRAFVLSGGARGKEVAERRTVIFGCDTVADAWDADGDGNKLRNASETHAAIPTFALRLPRSRGGFTLLELVIVLAILAVVTALATRALSGVEDQRHFEASQQGITELEAAVLGSDRDRAPDGSRINSGFVADMGRLPRTVGSTQLTLAELWVPPVDVDFIFQVRKATTDHFSNAAEEEDPQVWVAGGWRGPYLRLPVGARNLLDGWGNEYRSPVGTVDPDTADTTSYPRLRNDQDVEITEAGHDIAIVRHLGANGKRVIADTEESYDRDEIADFREYTATVEGSVEVLDGDSPATPHTGDVVTVKVYFPDPDYPSKIAVGKHEIPFDQNPVHFVISQQTVPVPAALTIGPRVVRAYFKENPSGGTTTFRKSGVKNVTLRSGVNHLDLTIDRQ